MQMTNFEGVRRANFKQIYISQLEHVPFGW